LERASEECCSFRHADESIARAVVRGGVAVVGHGQMHVAVGANDVDCDAGGMAGVAASVGDCLLGQTEQAGLDRWAEVFEVAGELDIDAGSGPSGLADSDDVVEATVGYELGLFVVA